MSHSRSLKIYIVFISGLILSGGFSVSCSTLSPPLKSQNYLGVDIPTIEQSSFSSFVGSRKELRIGLFMVFDTSDPDSAPGLSDDGQSRFLARVVQHTEEMLPLKVEEVFGGADVKPGKGREQFVNPTRGKEIDGIMVVVISGIESQTPAYLHSTVEVGSLPGFQTENFSLVEMTLLEPSDGNPLLQAQGRAYATLEHLAEPLSSNRYPNIRRSSQERPIFLHPGNAHEDLRMVTLSDALDQAISNLKKELDRSLVAT